jgi:adenylylsulfate kinase
VDTPLEVCEARDPKGLYQKARRGEIKHFTGIDDPYEIPEAPDIHLKTNPCSVEQCLDQVWDYLKKRGFII